MTEDEAKANLKRVRDHIASLQPELFDMGDWGMGFDEAHDCGTPACIGGWAERLLFADAARAPSVEEVGAALGLRDYQSRQLFLPYGVLLPDGHEAFEASREQAISVLDHFAATGEVDWSKAGAS